MSATRDQLARQGRAAVLAFCQANGMPPPTFAGEVPAYVGSCGLYSRGRLYVTVPACARLGYGGPAWSWPGYMVDRTPFGVYCHELGHYVDDLCSRKGTDFAQAMRKASGEAKLTNYCPNTAEWLAEMMRLFITDPDLLQAVRPRTYESLVGAGLLPSELRPWQDVLAGAPARTLAMAARRAAEAAAV